MAQIRSKPFGVTKEGANVTEYILSNPGGLTVSVLDYGCVIKSIIVPAKNGPVDVVVGHDTMADYEADFNSSGSTCCGAFVGRYANRIENAVFTVGGKTYQLEANNGPNHLHGCFSRKLYRVKSFGDTLLMEAESPDGEDGFPGNLRVHVIFVLTKDNELDIHYEAETDKPTVINLSHHSFFNISGDFNTTVEDQSLYINADMYTPYDSLKCVTGEILPVAGTPFDFTTPHVIGERIDEDVMQLNIVKGYDHNWVLNTDGDDTKLAARLIDFKSGRTMEIYTNEPGLQIYTANGLRGAMVGKKGIAYQKRSAICMETQHFADSPNKPQFPSTVLRPGENYKSRCTYRFGIEK